MKIKFIINIFIILNIIVPVISTIRLSISDFKVKFNHIFLFSVGFIYYLLVPIIVGINKLFVGYPAMDIWYQHFESIPEKNLLIYLLIILLWYVSFLSGFVWSYKYKYEQIQNKNYLILKDKTINFFFYISFILSLVYIFNFRNALFKGYSVEANTTGQKGSFVALTLVVLALAVMNAANELIKSNYKATLKELFINRFFIYYYFLSILVISLGGRLYFITGLIVTMVFLTMFSRKVDFRKLIIPIFLVIMVMGIIGSIRGGRSAISLNRTMFNLLQEPLYTSFSLVSFLKSNSFPVLEFPSYLLSSVINLVPSILMPNKISYIRSISEAGYYIYTPLGAMNIFVSLVTNFGVLGSSIVLFFSSYYLAKLSRNIKSILSITMYSCITGFITFSLFRDGFTVSVIKNILEFSILIPILIVYSEKIADKVINNQFSLIFRREKTDDT